MPLYEYQCKKCKHRFEKIEGVSASTKKTCPKCGGPAERTISAPAIQFKGAGWYVNDYGKGAKSGSDEKAEKTEKADGKTKEKSGEKTGEKPAEKSGEKSDAKAPATEKAPPKSEVKKKSKE